MKCLNPILLKNPKQWDERRKDLMKGMGLEKLNEPIMVACGKCGACKENITRHYMIRFRHEASEYKYKWFGTMTYDEKNITKDYGLNKKHATDYIKRVNKQMKKEGNEWKYFLSGEYGEIGSRPHYHIVAVSNTAEMERILSEKWEYGKTEVERCDDRAIQYVIGYVDKKIIGGMKAYGERTAPFRKFSKGLGKKYLKKNAKRIAKDKYIPIQEARVSLSKYYKDKLKEWGEITTEEMKKLAFEEEKKMFNYLYEKYGNKTEIYIEDRKRINYNVIEAGQRILEQRKENYRERIQRKKSRTGKL